MLSDFDGEESATYLSGGTNTCLTVVETLAEVAIIYDTHVTSTIQSFDN